MALQRHILRRKKIEMLLLKEKIEDGKIMEIPTDEWLALWEEYAKDDRKLRSLWGEKEILLNSSNPIRIFENLQFLKKINKDLFAEIFEEHFIVNLIWNFSIKRTLLYINEPREFALMFINFVKKNMEKDTLKGASEDVLFNRMLNDVLEINPFTGMISMVDVVSSINTWKACFQKEVHIDLLKMPDLKKMTMRCWPMLDELKDLKEDYLPFLNAVDGFKGGKTFFIHGSNTKYLEEFVEHADQELMLMALKKNFIDVECIDKTIELAMKADKFEFLPLLILKKNSKANN